MCCFPRSYNNRKIDNVSTKCSETFEQQCTSLKNGCIDHQPRCNLHGFILYSYAFETLKTAVRDYPLTRSHRVETDCCHRENRCDDCNLFLLFSRNYLSSFLDLFFPLGEENRCAGSWSAGQLSESSGKSVTSRLKRSPTISLFFQTREPRVTVI